MRKHFKQIGYNTLIQILGKTLSIFLGLVSVSVLTRYLGKDGFGEFTLTIAYLSFFGVVADLGLQLTITRDFIRKYSSCPEFFGTYLILKIFLGIAFILISCSALILFPYNTGLKLGIIIASLGVALGLINNVGTVIFQSNLRLDIVTIIDTVTRIVTLLTIALVILLNRGYYSILATLLLGNISGSLLNYFFIKRFVKIDLSYDSRLAVNLLSKSIPVFFLSVLTMSYFKIDTIILSLFKPNSDVGIYGLSYKIFENTHIIWGFYIASVYPLMSRLLGAKKIKDSTKLWVNSVRLSILSALLIIVIGYFISPLIIRLIGGDGFDDSVLVLRILLFSLPLFFLNNLIYHILLIKEKVREIMIALSICLTLNVLLNFQIIPKYGYIGASINTFITEGILLFFYARIFYKTKIFAK